MRSVLVLFLAMIVLIGCGKTELSHEEQLLVGQLKSELQTLEADLAAANAADSRFSGGLIKTLIASRLEVLKTSKALLTQRIHAVESGARVTVSVPVSHPNAEEAERLQGDISLQEEELRKVRADADQYTGGLLQAMKLSTVAMQEQTLAMLKQRHLIVKYGLGFVAGGVGIASPSQLEPTTPNATAQSKSSPTIPPANGPFGLKEGITLDQIEAMIGGSLTRHDNSPNLFITAMVPKPHAAFENYALLIGPNAGLCQIRAIGQDISTSSHGVQLRSSFSELESPLIELYGRPDKLDRLLSGSIWRDPQHWMRGLVEGERFLVSEWQGKGSSTLKNNLRSVALAAQARDSSTGYLLLQYTFANNDLCEEEVQRVQKDSL